MKLQILFALSALVALAGCAKTQDVADNATKADKEAATDKVIAEYLGVVETPPTEMLDGIDTPVTFSESKVIFAATGGEKEVTTNASFLTRSDMMLKVGEQEAALLSATQNSPVQVDVVLIQWDRYSQVRVPSGKQEKVRYTDGTYGYIPDSVVVAAYPVAGTGYRPQSGDKETQHLLLRKITADWFTVTFDYQAEFGTVEVEPYYATSDFSLEKKTVYNHRGQIVSRFLNGATTYIHRKSAAAVESSSFKIEVTANTSGQARSFELLFPRVSGLDGTTVLYGIFSVVQQ